MIGQSSSSAKEVERKYTFSSCRPCKYGEYKYTRSERAAFFQRRRFYHAGVAGGINCPAVLPGSPHNALGIWNDRRMVCAYTSACCWLSLWIDPGRRQNRRSHWYCSARRLHCTDYSRWGRPTRLEFRELSWYTPCSGFSCLPLSSSKPLGRIRRHRCCRLANP